MNEFTKEELFEILGLASNAYGIKGSTMSIIVKIQSMIDSYCYHEYRTSHESHFKCKASDVREK
jgi:hypothetical protein